MKLPTSKRARELCRTIGMTSLAAVLVMIVVKNEDYSLLKVLVLGVIGIVLWWAGATEDDQ